MNYLNPIYTEKTQCQDCYKCLRNCPVKAIKIEDAAATVIAEQCICCGHCVEVCPNGAKRVRDDLERARHLLLAREKVYLSLAPSFVSDFPGVSAGQMVAAAKKLGFAGVSETALGAEAVSAAAGEMLDGIKGVMLSTACPTVVAFVRRHHQEHAKNLTPLLSPLLTHCRMLRKWFGEGIGVVFAGPCIAKKLEADGHREILDVALTFEELRRWMEAEGVSPERAQAEEGDVFVPERSAEGAWYPIDGGMIAGVKRNCRVTEGSLMAFSGLGAIEKALAGLEGMGEGEALFLELLACEGGCVNGPRAAGRCGTAAKRRQVLGYGRVLEGRAADGKPARMEMFHVEHFPNKRFTEVQVREALRAVGKYGAEDELNCGGCGYDSCLGFGEALLEGKAERTMCVTYMRKLAQKKANALIAKMPSAVVIVGEEGRVLECNDAFVGLFGKNGKRGEEGILAMEGVPAANVVPFANLFTAVLRSGDDVVERDIRHNQAILHVTVFTIEKGMVVGAIIQDVTAPVVQKEQVIRKAQEVIRNNLGVVQKIAHLLGENAAESEITLNQIIDSFTPRATMEDGQKTDKWRKAYRRGS